MVSKIVTSYNERWTQYDYELCVANEWDIDFCAEHLRRSVVAIKKAKQKYDLTYHKPSLWEKGGRTWHTSAIEVLIQHKKKAIAEKTIMDKLWWHQLQAELFDIEGFYRNYKQCDMKLEGIRNKIYKEEK
jgi:hypothetical protein|tara:strand:+ start:258 stop:647 length:390 start_codon:yes stop_codon:yes gene_type:complete